MRDDIRRRVFEIIPYFSCLSEQAKSVLCADNGQKIVGGWFPLFSSILELETICVLYVVHYETRCVALACLALSA